MEFQLLYRPHAGNFFERDFELIGAKKVSIRKSYNDIEPKDTVTNKGSYSKIGSVNGKRSDGYYLESEDEDELYLIWAD